MSEAPKFEKSLFYLFFYHTSQVFRFQWFYTIFLHRIPYFFGKTAFLQISADFVTGFENFFLSESSSDKDAKNFFVAQVVSEIYAKNKSFKNS